MSERLTFVRLSRCSCLERVDNKIHAESCDSHLRSLVETAERFELELLAVRCSNASRVLIGRYDSTMQ